jgi:hypothetical protein
VATGPVDYDAVIAHWEQVQGAGRAG